MNPLPYLTLILLLPYNLPQPIEDLDPIPLPS